MARRDPSGSSSFPALMNCFALPRSRGGRAIGTTYKFMPRLYWDIMNHSCAASGQRPAAARAARLIEASDHPYGVIPATKRCCHAGPQCGLWRAADASHRGRSGASSAARSGSRLAYSPCCRRHALYGPADDPSAANWPESITEERDTERQRIERAFFSILSLFFLSANFGG